MPYANQKMAEAVSTEWNDQKDEVKPWSMPITKLMNTAIDRVGKPPRYAH